MENILSNIFQAFTQKTHPSNFPARLSFGLIFLQISLIMVFSFGTGESAFAATASLSWNANTETDLAGYKVYYGTVSGIYGAPINVGSQTSHTLTGLSNNTYYFSVTAYDTSGNESGKSLEVSKAISSADTTSPLVSSIAVSGISETSATITWTTNEPADTQLEYGITTAYGTMISLDSSLLTSHQKTLASLLSATTYHYRVLSRDGAGNLTTSGDNTFITATPADTTAPSISGISSSNITNASVTITWTTDEGASSRVEYGTTQSYGSSSQSSAFTTSHSRSLVNLTPSTTYNYRIISADAAGNIATSGNFTFTTTDGSVPQSLVSNLVVASGKPYEVIQSGLSNGNMSYIDRTYTLGGLPASLSGAAYIKTANDDKGSTGSGFLTFDVNKNVVVYVAHDDRSTVKPTWLSMFTDTGDDVVIAGDAHSLFKKSFSSGSVSLGGNEGSNSTSMYVVIIDASGTGSTDTDPPILSNINVSNITSAGALVTWNTNEGATSKVDFGLTTSYGSSSQIGAALVGSHSRLLSGLSPSTTYHYRVVSQDGVGNITLSSDITFVTSSSGDTTGPEISNIKVVMASSSTVITWATDEAATSQVEYGQTSAYGLAIPKNNTLLFNHKQTFTGLLEGVTYHFRVKSFDANGNSSFSDDKTFKTVKSSDEIPPDDILAFKAIGGNRQITLSWKNPSDLDFVGVRIRYRTDRFPKDLKDGTLLGDISGIPNAEMTTSHTGLINGMTYYYLAASYDGKGNFQSSVFASTKTGFPITENRDSDSEDETAGGCGMVFPKDGNSSGPGEAAGMLSLIGAMILMLIKTRFSSFLRKLKSA